MSRLTFTLQCAFVLFVLSQKSQGGVIYKENFESGTAPGWQLIIGGEPSFWHVTQNAPESGRFALGFVENETTGARLNVPA